MLTATKADERVRGLTVLLPLRGEAIGVIAVRIVEELGYPVRHRRGDQRQPSSRYVILVIHEVTHDFTHQHNKRRVYPLGLFDSSFQSNQAMQRLEGHLQSAAKDLLLLLQDRWQVLRVLQEQDAGPGGQYRTGVLTGKDEREQQASDGVVGQRYAIGIVGYHQGLE